jgi:hypothetical protein
MRKTQPGFRIAGLSLLVVGGWLMAREMATPAAGSEVIGLDRLWPIIPFLLGLALTVQYLAEKRKRDGLIVLGVAAMLSASFLCLFTLQIGRLDWPDMVRFWPVFPIIIGAALVTLYVAGGMQDSTLLRPAYLIGGIGVFALPFTLGVLRGAIFDQAARLWPVLAIVLLLLVLFSVRTRGQTPTERAPQEPPQ